MSDKDEIKEVPEVNEDELVGYIVRRPSGRGFGRAYITVL